MFENEGVIGAIQYREESVQLRSGKKRVKVQVKHCGDRPIQVGSHFHFFEVNKALCFDRKLAFGMHLDILSGTAIRFEPGEERTVTLVEFGGTGRLIGFNGLTMGSMHDASVREAAFDRARSQGYMDKDTATGE